MTLPPLRDRVRLAHADLMRRKVNTDEYIDAIVSMIYQQAKIVRIRSHEESQEAKAKRKAAVDIYFNQPHPSKRR